MDKHDILIVSKSDDNSIYVTTKGDIFEIAAAIKAITGGIVHHTMENRGRGVKKMNNILISIKPQWCNLILNGRKTLEIRKSKPNLTTPFRCYIYCSEKNAQNPHHILEIHNSDGKIIKANGKVIGEFICDYIKEYSTELYESDGEYYENIREVWQSEDDSSEEEYRIIASNDNGNLNHNEILQKSCLSLDELKKYVGLGDSHFFSWHISDFKLYDKPISIEKAPQTWCYCAKIKGEQNESDKKRSQ